MSKVSVCNEAGDIIARVEYNSDLDEAAEAYLYNEQHRETGECGGYVVHVHRYHFENRKTDTIRVKPKFYDGVGAYPPEVDQLTDQFGIDDFFDEKQLTGYDIGLYYDIPKNEIPDCVKEHLARIRDAVRDHVVSEDEKIVYSIEWI